MDRIVILGSSGHARVIVDIVEREGKHEIAGLLDPALPVGESRFGYPVLGVEEDLPRLVKAESITGALVAIGDNSIRARVAARVVEVCPGLGFVSAVHPAATVARDVTIGAGTVIMAGVTVNPACSIGRFCILNTNASLDHDGVMGDFSSLGPGVTTGGNCCVGDYSAVAIGAVVIHGIRIGEHSVVGAGATVVSDIGAFTVAYGTPARVIRARRAGDRYL